jgi:hypothetical protein
MPNSSDLSGTLFATDSFQTEETATDGSSSSGDCTVSISKQPITWTDSTNIFGIRTIQATAVFDISTTCDPKTLFIRQFKTGKVVQGGVTTPFPDWTLDGDPIWNDGEWGGIPHTDWQTQSDGSHKASWTDKPGFERIESTDYPIYFGAIPSQGLFDFEIDVVKSSGDITKAFWGILIDYKTATDGVRLP